MNEKSVVRKGGRRVIMSLHLLLNRVIFIIYISDLVYIFIQKNFISNKTIYSLPYFYRSMGYYRGWPEQSLGNCYEKK